MKQHILLILLVCFCVSLYGCSENPVEDAFATASTVPETASPTTALVTIPTEPEPQPESFTLTFVGDCTLGASPANAYADMGFLKTVGEDYGYPFRNVLDYFAGDEATFANLEGPLTDEGYPQEKTHTFRGPEDYVKILTENSVEFVSLANNHTHDYGQRGYDNTLRVLEEAGVPYVQRDASQIFTTPNGLTIGVYGAVYYGLDREDMVQEIGNLRQQCDVVIYAPHWGVEKTYAPTREQTEMGRAAIDAGADIVWGSHPHALQPMEHYENGVIFYSLGNFSFGGNSMPEDFDTAILQVEIIRDAEGRVTLGEIRMIPCCISSIPERNNYQPTPYEAGTEGYDRSLAKLAGTWNPSCGKNQ